MFYATIGRLRQVAKCNIYASMKIAQCRMARAGLDWSRRELSDRSGVALRTVARFEDGETVKVETVEALRSALVTGGAVFVDQGGRVGVLIKP